MPYRPAGNSSSPRLQAVDEGFHRRIGISWIPAGHVAETGRPVALMNRPEDDDEIGKADSGLALQALMPSPSPTSLRTLTRLRCRTRISGWSEGAAKWRSRMIRMLGPGS